MKVLSLNLGSSSLKYAVHEVENGGVKRLIARDVVTSSQPAAAAAATRSAIADVLKDAGQVDAAGHRIVFGGNDDETARITPELFARLDDLQSLDPLHAPGALAVIREAQRLLPGVAQVACFDTAFFRHIPRTAHVLAIPQDDSLLRRYGFHGLSYESVRASLGSELSPRTIVAHLGNGASLAALYNGRPIDMTMGFSPLAGIIMSTRPGDLDPGAILYLLERKGLTPPQLRDMLETQSGLRALSGGESDLQRLCERSDEAAHFAVEMFVRSVAKAIGALATDLGGLDMLVFTGGIGEHNTRVRDGVVSRVSFLNSGCDVRVVQSDENLQIADNAAGLLRIGASAF